MNTFASTRPRVRIAALAAGVATVVAAPFAVPSSSVLPGPENALEQLASLTIFGIAFAIGLARPRRSIYLLVALAVLEGAVRKWIVNDITVFLAKDFLLLGIYAAVLPSLSARDLRRSPWLIVPLAGLAALAVLYSASSDSLSQAAIGLRSYLLYVPLLWVAPKLLDTQRRVSALLGLVLALGLLQSVLATIQTVTGNAFLNESVAGARPALVVVGDSAYIRATGTMLQVGTLAAFLLFPLLTAFALIMRYNRGPGLAGGLVSIAILSWGVTYTGSRALFATAALAAAFLLVYLAWRRRFLSLAAVPLSAAVAFLLIANQPFVGAGGEGSLRTEQFTYIDGDGSIKTEEFPVGTRGAGVAGGFLSRGGGRIGRSGLTEQDRVPQRISGQLGFIARQRLAGKGTGALSLGSQYLLPEREEAAESEYAKVAYELGLPALVLFLWLLAALWAAAAWSSFVALDWQAPATIVALGAATLVPLLTLLTYAFDYPIVALLYYSLTGCAAAWASGASRATAPVRAAAAVT